MAGCAPFLIVVKVALSGSGQEGEAMVLAGRGAAAMAVGYVTAASGEHPTLEAMGRIRIRRNIGT